MTHCERTYSCQERSRARRRSLPEPLGEPPPASPGAGSTSPPLLALENAAGQLGGPAAPTPAAQPGPPRKRRRRRARSLSSASPGPNYMPTYVPGRGLDWSAVAPLSPISSDPTSADEEEAQENWDTLLPWVAATTGRGGRYPFLHWAGAALREGDARGTARSPAGCVLLADGISRYGEDLAQANLLCATSHSPQFTWCGKCRSKMLRQLRTAETSMFP